MDYRRILDKYVNAAPGASKFISEFGSYRDLWDNTWEPTARAASRKEAVDYVNPLRRKAQHGVKGDLAKRGMFRSSALKKNLGQTRDEYDRERDVRTESGVTTRDREKREAYDSFLRLYEDDPTGARKGFSDLIKSYKA